MNNTSSVAWGLAKGLAYYYGLRIAVVVGFMGCSALIIYVIYAIAKAL